MPAKPYDRHALFEALRKERLLKPTPDPEPNSVPGADTDAVGEAPKTQWRVVDTASTERVEPFVKLLFDADRPELWLVFRDANGLVRPCPDTGPLQVPEEWQVALQRAKDFHS